MSQGYVTTGPRNATVLLGLDVTLQCMTNLSEPVDWYYRSSNTAQVEYIAASGRIQPQSHERYVMVKEPVGSYDLVIHNAQSRDTGWYQCVDDAGIGMKSEQAYLQVVTGMLIM